MMDHLATKTIPEREDEEAHRLVRPNPKYKPPRRDRRREQVQVNQDSDKEADPDLSKNYKDIGGSVVRKWAKKKIPVRNKETDRIVWVTPRTLEKERGKYEPLKREEAQKAKERRNKEKGKLEEVEEPKVDEGEEASDVEFAVEVSQKWIYKGRHKQPAFQRFLDAIPTGDINSMTGEVLVLDPKTRQRVPFDQLDPEIQKALIDEYSERREAEDLAKVTRDQAEAKEREVLEAGEKAVKYLSESSTDVRKALVSLGDPDSDAYKQAVKLEKLGYDLNDIRLEKLFPKLRGKIPEDLKSVAVAQSIVRSAAEYSAMPEPYKAGVGEPERRKVSKEEQQRTLSFLMDNLPPAMATRLFELDIHPDDARSLVAYYREAKKDPVKDPIALAEKVSEVYTEDPARVKPPEKWEGKRFHHLKDAEKAEVLRQHQLKVLAISAAAKDQLTEVLRKGTSGVPLVLASTLANSMLMPRKHGKAGTRQTQQMAQMVFDTMMREGGYIPMSAKAVKILMGRLDFPSQEIARAFLQANDYHAVKKEFLNRGSGISEYASPRSIIRGLRKARHFLSERASVYGGGNVAQRLFDTRVMDRLRILAPEKYRQVRAQLDMDERAEYDRAHKKWEKQHEKWLIRKRRQGKAFDEPEPIEPTKPLHYESHQENTSGGLWESVFGQPKTANRVARRYQHLTSIYSCGMAMGHTFKKAVYHGVEPDGVTYYPRWEQAHQRDLGEADFALILDDARKWLKTPGLSVKDMLPDQRFRAALDYAIQTGIYSQAISPVLYNMLLARLAGWPEPGPEQTLQTIRGSTCETPISRRSNMAVKTAEQSKYASSILGRLDKLALDIQNHYEKWGMSKQEAKETVNNLDRVADDFEAAAFGKESLEKRQREVMAAVVQQDVDEPYMGTFQNPKSPVQMDADEPYMGAYSDDQSSAVEREFGD